jgi:hypothetical protein
MTLTNHDQPPKYQSSIKSIRVQLRRAAPNRAPFFYLSWR